MTGGTCRQTKPVFQIAAAVVVVGCNHGGLPPDDGIGGAPGKGGAMVGVAGAVAWGGHAGLGSAGGGAIYSGGHAGVPIAAFSGGNNGVGGQSTSVAGTSSIGGHLHGGSTAGAEPSGGTGVTGGYGSGGLTSGGNTSGAPAITNAGSSGASGDTSVGVGGIGRWGGGGGQGAGRPSTGGAPNGTGGLTAGQPSTGGSSNGASGTGGLGTGGLNQGGSAGSFNGGTAGACGDACGVLQPIDCARWTEGSHIYFTALEGLAYTSVGLVPEAGIPPCSWAESGTSAMNGMTFALNGNADGTFSTEQTVLGFDGSIVTTQGNAVTGKPATVTRSKAGTGESCGTLNWPYGVYQTFSVTIDCLTGKLAVERTCEETGGTCGTLKKKQVLHLRPTSLIPGYDIVTMLGFVAQGSTVTVDWRAPTEHSTDDWIGLYADGKSGPDFLARTNLGNIGETEGTVSMVVPAGTTGGGYDFKLYLNNVAADMGAWSQPFRVF